VLRPVLTGKFANRLRSRPVILAIAGSYGQGTQELARTD